MNAWIGVDLDGTLAHFDGWIDNEFNIGHPIPAMVELVRQWLAAGWEVRVFTARVAGPDTTYAEKQRAVIEAWCAKHLGAVLPVTASKDFCMVALYDDLAVAVERNTGRVLGGNHGAN